MALNPELARHLELKTEEKFKELGLLTRWFIASLILLVLIFFAVVAHAMLKPIHTDDYQSVRSTAWFAIQLTIFLFGPLIVLLVGVGFAAADFSRLWTKLFGEEIETFAAIKRTAWVIGYVITALNVPFLWDFSKTPSLYPIMLGAIGIIYYEAGSYPKTVLKEKGKKS